MEEDLHTPQRLAFVDLLANLLEAQNVALAVFRPAVERAELSVGDADIGVVDVSVDDVGHDICRVLPPPLCIREAPELEQARPLIELEIFLEFTGTAIYGHWTPVVRIEKGSRG